MLEIVLADHADMVRRAAGHNENAGKFAHFLDRELEIVEDDPAVLDARGDRAAQRLGLLHDLLEHEVLVAALSAAETSQSMVKCFFSTFCSSAS